MATWVLAARHTIDVTIWRWSSVLAEGYSPVVTKNKARCKVESHAPGFCISYEPKSATHRTVGKLVRLVFVHRNRKSRIDSKRGFSERQCYKVLVKQVIEHHNMLVRAALVGIQLKPF